MATNTGTLTLKDLHSERHQSVATFGMDTIVEVIQRDMAAYNRQLTDMFTLLADRTMDRLRVSGASAAGEMVDVDEVGRAPTQKAGAGATVGFPLRAKQFNLAWTRRWFMAHSPAEMAEQTLNAQQAHMRGLIRDMKRAIYTATNSTIRDRLQAPQIDLAVKVFANADSFPVPNGPNGEIYTAASHTHYTAAAALAAADIVSLINTVVEHGHGARVIMAISATDATAISALTGFVAAQPATIRLADTTASTVATLDTSRLNDRMIGIFNGTAEVWVKPWAIANYVFVFDAEDARKSLVLRTRTGAAPTLDIVSQFEHFPLTADYMETEYGFGVWTRTNGAVYFFAGGTYVSPTIT